MKSKIIYLYFLILFVSSALSAQVLYTDIKTLAQNAYEIVEGRVVKVVTKWDDEHKFIYTFTKIQLSKLYKNKITEKDIILKEIGGSLGEFTTYAPCQPEYKKNEYVLIFLQKESTYYRTYGLNQGKFNIKIINAEKKLRRKINVDELTILNNKIKKENIKQEFRYVDVITTISKSNKPQKGRVKS